MREYSFTGLIAAPELHAKVSITFYSKAVMSKMRPFYLCKMVRNLILKKQNDVWNSTKNYLIRIHKKKYYSPVPYIIGDRGGTVVKVLCYKPEGRWFDPSWCHWNISLT